MNYEKIYYDLMNKRKVNKLTKNSQYCERHHIIPKSLGGSNSSNNLVNLTPKEHFIAHRFLERFTRIKYGKNSKEYKSMAQALWFMIHDKKYPMIKMTSKEYAAIRTRYALSISGKNNRWFGITGSASKSYGRKHSKESNKANSIAHIGRKHMHNPITDEAAFVRKNEIQLYLQNGYVLGMSQHERNSISKRNTKQKHMYNPITDEQVYAQPNDIQNFLNKGFIFGRNMKSRNKHNDILRNRLAFYDRNTGKKFYVDRCQYAQTIQQGHIPSKLAVEKMKSINGEFSYV